MADPSSTTAPKATSSTPSAPTATASATSAPVTSRRATRSMTGESDLDKMNRTLRRVLDLLPTSPLLSGLDMMQIKSLRDIRTLTDTDIDKMQYEHKEPRKGEIKAGESSFITTTKDVPFPLKKLLKLFLHYTNYIASQQVDHIMSVEVWEGMTSVGFDQFVQKYPQGAPTGSGTSAKGGGATPSSVVTTSKVDNFLSSIKLDMNSFPKFNGRIEQWLNYKRKLDSVASIHNLGRILTNCRVPPAGTEDRRLFDTQNTYMYSVFAKTCTEGTPLLVIRKFETTRDGQKVFLEMKEFFESDHNMTVVVQKCYQALSEVKLTKGYNGGAERFLHKFQNTYLDLEYASKSDKEDVEKKARLLSAIHDPHYFSVRDVLATDPNKTYNECIYCISQHAALFTQSPPRGERSDARQTNSADTTRRGRRSSGPRRGGRGQGQARRRSGHGDPNDKGRIRSDEEWNNLSQTEKDEIFEYRRKQGRRKANNSRVTDKASESSEQGSETKKSPTIRGIMRSQVRKTNMIVTIRNMSAAQDTPDGDAVVDGGADTIVMGKNFKIISKDIHRHVTVIGCKEDTMQSKGHYIGCGVTKARTVDDEYILLVANESVCMENGKTLFSANQVRAAGHEVSDVPTKYGGSQCIVLNDGPQLPLVYRDGLCTLAIELPTEDDLMNLDRYEITLDTPWDPSGESDANIDALRDEYDAWVDEVNVRHILATRTTPDALTPKQLERMRNCLLFKPARVVRATLDNTTQLAHNYIRTPLRQHWKARFPGLNCRRMREVMSTDTFFSSEVGRNGETCAQLYVGKHSTFTVVKCMKTESQMPDTLLDLIREYGAPTALFSDNAKSETSKAVKDILRQYNIHDMQSEPHHPNQNPAERRIGTIKRTTNHIMNRTRCPKDLWFMCMTHVVMVLNHVSIKGLDWKTPVEVAFGVTPDISALLQFRWYEPVRYLAMINNKWLEKNGHFVGVATNIGDALTYYVLTEDDQVLARSVVAPAHLPIDDTAHLDETPDTIPIDGGEGSAGDMLINPASGPNDGIQHEEHDQSERTYADVARDVVRNPGIIRQAEATPPHKVDVRDAYMYDEDVDADMPDLVNPDGDDSSSDDSSMDSSMDGSGIPTIQHVNPEPGSVPMEVECTSPILESEADVLDPSRLRYPVVDPDELIGFTFIKQQDDGEYKAEVIEQIEDSDKFLLSLGDGEREDIIEYNDLIDAYLARGDDPDEEYDGKKAWVFEEILDHRKKRGKYELEIRWADGTQSWEPLAVISKDDPITVSEYARDHGLLETPGWKRLKHHSRQYKKKFIRLARVVHAYKSARRDNKVKFGIPVPNNVKQALAIDTQNKDGMWREAIKKEMGQLIDYNVFKDMGLMRNAKLPPGYKIIRANTIFDVKHDLRRKARFVAMGNLTEPPKESVYSSVVSVRSLRIVMLLAELNGLNIYACDIGNAYLEAKTKEKIAIIGGPEFRDFGLEGHLLLIDKALYGLRTSGARFWEHLSDYLRDLGWSPSKADPDVWIKDEGDYYAYIGRYVDDLLIAHKDPQKIIDDLEKRYILKGVGPPSYHLGGDFERKKTPEEVLTWGSKTYITRCLQRYEEMYNEKPRGNTYAPLDKNDSPELDTSDLCNEAQIKEYQSLMGMLQWAVTLGRMDIMCAVMTMSRYRAAPRIGHLDRVKRIFGYLRNYRKTAIKFRCGIPDYSDFEDGFSDQDWTYQYGNIKEEIPSDAPPPKGKKVRITVFADANLMHDKVTGRSCTGILTLLNKTPIDWYSKRQATVESATYGSEFVAARIAVEQIMDLRYTLRMFGVELDGPAYLFGDNLSVITQSTIPSSTLKKRHNAIAFHRVREAVAAKIIIFLKIDGTENPADILTKLRSNREWFPLMKPMIFWDQSEDDVGAKEKKNASENIGSRGVANSQHGKGKSPKGDTN